MSSLLFVGIFGQLMAPLQSDALTVTIDDRPVQITTTAAACTSGYNLCAFIPPGTYGAWTVRDVSSTNKARIMIGDNSAAGSLDLLKLTGITFTPVVTEGTKTTRVVVTHTYSAGGGNPAGDYAWGYGMAGYLDPPPNENIAGDQLQQTGQGNFAGKIAALGLGLDTGRFATPTTNNLHGRVTKSRAAAVVMPACNTGSARCAPAITQTFTLTVTGADMLVLSDSVVAAGGTCRPVEQVIPIPPHLYSVMLKLDPQAPNDINQLSKWLAKMGEKYLKNAKQKALLAWLIKELDKWLAATVPGTCPEIFEEINQVVGDDAEDALNAVTLAGPFAPAEPGGGTITITKQTSQATNDRFTFTISGPSASTQTIAMGNQNSEEVVVSVQPGTYSISENSRTGWELTSFSCAGGSTTGFAVELGANVDCTFTNTYSGTAGTATLTGLGVGNLASEALDVSSNGSVVVGHGVAGTREAFLWSAGTGKVSLTPGVFGRAEATSNDGSVVVGSAIFGGAVHAFRWTTGPVLADLGTLSSAGLPPVSSEALGISGDGNVVVGYTSFFDGVFGSDEPFRWTQSEGMVRLGNLPSGLSPDGQASAVSNDGSVIVGWAVNASGSQEMFKWTSADGMQGLGPQNVRPSAVSGDGSFIVGQNLDGIFSEAFYWSQLTGLVNLPGLAGATNSQRSGARDVSSDGSIIVGWAMTPLDTQEAVIWRWNGNSWGIKTLKDVLVTDFGIIAATGWQFTVAEGISPDGRTIVGTGINPNNILEAWRIQLP
ncbi:MAG: hypothetical protein HP491_17760 [Nitrospira sp.]|nr:hypothetical protein [Nitrospira sp.]